ANRPSSTVGSETRLMMAGWRGKFRTSSSEEGRDRHRRGARAELHGKAGACSLRTCDMVFFPFRGCQLLRMAEHWLPTA
ncbi:MAG: hypothetical protein ACI91F_000238, partial [Candidatus Binatia bacterium]